MINRPQRCAWIEGKPDYYIHYHDITWGKPEHDDRKLFRWLILELFHIGLSWQLVLSKQDNFDKAFDEFDARKIALYDEDKIEDLLRDHTIIRHRKKIEATINNARVFLTIQQEYGSFDAYIWQFTQGKSIQKKCNEEAKTQSSLSDLVTKSLKQKGFKFLGSVTVYSYLQAIGVVNDHDIDCDFR